MKYGRLNERGKARCGLGLAACLCFWSVQLCMLRELLTGVLSIQHQGISCATCSRVYLLSLPVLNKASVYMQGMCRITGAGSRKPVLWRPARQAGAPL